MELASPKRQSLFDVGDKLTSNCVGFLNPALPNGQGRGSALTLFGGEKAGWEKAEN